MAEVYKECKPKEEKDTPVAEVRQKLVKRILDKKNPEVHATVCIEDFVLLSGFTTSIV